MGLTYDQSNFIRLVFLCSLFTLICVLQNLYFKAELKHVIPVIMTVLDILDIRSSTQTMLDDPSAWGA